MSVSLVNKYTGAVAETYERDRTKSWKWNFEDDAVRQAFEHLPGIKTLIDVPCGTGRFHSLYKELGIEAMGVDVSADMLRQADAKGMAVMERDLFTMTVPDEHRYDCLLCVRFLNWLDPVHLESAIEIMASFASKYFIISVSTHEPGCEGKSKNQYYPSFEELDGYLKTAHMVKRVVISEDAGRGVKTNIIAGDITA